MREPRGSSIAPEADATDADAACDVTVRQLRELMITDLAVVEDPVRTRWTGGLTDPADGAWHFGRMMTAMAGPTDPDRFVRSWLAQWETARPINDQVIPARPAISDVIDAWPKRADGSLDLRRPPLRLLAIVNRFDLRQPGNAGEGRFVFGVLAANGAPLQFTVILEYKMPAAGPAAVRRWADAWAALGELQPSSKAYRRRLQAITDGFAARNAAPGQINGSAISQVRTNEIALASPWELREFRLTTAGRLRMAPVALTPANDHDLAPLLADYINANADAIKAGTHVVPRTFAGVPFAGGAVTNEIDHWDAPGIADLEARHLFSLNTCNGCHGAESGTFFLHVEPRRAGDASTLSTFLTGADVDDPVTGETRHFDDLARRARDLKAFLCAP